MKNFDLEAAKAGAPVCTINSEPARIICTDRGHNVYTVIALVDVGGYEDMRSYTASGVYDISGKTRNDGLMMRDDDYAEKLARGEYGNHIGEATEKVEPVVMENLNVDREYWRRVYVGEIMPVVLSAAITTHAKIKDEYKGMPAEVAVARSAIVLADALLEELEKK